MCKLLLLGVNTRSMVISALKLGFDVYSSSYYKTYDFNENINEKHILDQKAGYSCGYFEDKYSPEKILENAESYLPIVDYIILCSGVSPNDFKGKYAKYLFKVIGNKDVMDVEDKYRFYEKVSCDFLVPETFKVNDIHEVYENLKYNKEKEFILKPNYGSGGYNIFLLKYDKFNINNFNENDYENFNENEWILQEKINGTNLSSSVLSTKKETKTIINSRLLNLNDYNIPSYKYGGNILPLTEASLKILNKSNTIPTNLNIEKLNKTINETSENIIKKLNLIGSNGVDLILTNNNKLYIIEVNPRLQGTYECIEQILKINMVNAHIKACNGEIINIQNKKTDYCIKKLIYTKTKTKIGNLNYPNIYDIPYPNVEIEKNQPLVTLITKDKDLKKANDNIIKTEKKLKIKIQELN